MLSPLRPSNARRKVSDGASVVAPVGGWNDISPLADMPEDHAIVLENWIPRPGYIEIRRGNKVHAHGMGSANAVQSLMPYNAQATANSKLIAVANGAFFEVGSGATASAIASATGFNTSRWQHVNFAVAGGTQYLWACSGTDNPQAYNGSAWVVPSISGITASDIVHVNIHKNRMFYILVNSMKFAYLQSTDAFQGSANTFNLGNVLDDGGFLMAMGTWTLDGGNGVDDYAVFISNKGQVAVYSGTDPSDATKWSLVGVYNLGPPIGRRCFTKVAGDLALINMDGILPLSKALTTDRGAAAAVALTKNINNAVLKATRAYSANFGWELTAYPRGGYALLNVPISTSVQQQYGINTLTGAWFKQTNMNANCWAVYNDNLYFGGNNGIVYQADIGSQDNGSAIDATSQQAYNYFKSRGKLKHFTMMRPLITTDSTSIQALGISTDFKDNASLGTPTSATVISALYDTAVWDTDSYAEDARSITDWTAISGIGHCASIHIRGQVNGNSTGDIIVQLNGYDIIYEKGEFL